MQATEYSTEANRESAAPLNNVAAAKAQLNKVFFIVFVPNLNGNPNIINNYPFRVYIRGHLGKIWQKYNKDRSINTDVNSVEKTVD